MSCLKGLTRLSEKGPVNLAVLKAKIKIKNPRIRAGIKQKTYDVLWKMAVRTLLPGPPGGGGGRANVWADSASTANPREAAERQQKPCKFIWFGDIHGPTPYKFIGFRWAFISGR